MINNGEMVQFLKQKDYIMLNNDLGGGSFGKTVLLQDPFIEELFVAKKYEPEYEGVKERFYKNFLDEIKILYKLNHRNIVRIYNYYAYDEIYTGYILMEYIDGTDIGNFLAEYAKSSNPIITLDELFIQLIDGFCYIEDHSIIHRDIREGNILIDKNGVVKIIDFGIGKIYEKIYLNNDSLVDEINRGNSDTLPQEFYDGVYTSKTDMFYLAELINRLIQNAVSEGCFDFSYQDIVNKMMQKQPSNRYVTFAAIKQAIGKHDFINMEISTEDKEIYQAFANIIFDLIVAFTDEAKFNHEIDVFISKLEKVLRNNLFEDYVQNAYDFINSVVLSEYLIRERIVIPCEVVKNFVDWFRASTYESQKLILSNIISKLSKIRVLADIDVPF